MSDLPSTPAAAAGEALTIESLLDVIQEAPGTAPIHHLHRFVAPCFVQLAELRSAQSTGAVDDDIVERACAAWWDILRPDGRRWANISWNEAPEEWKPFYRSRMRVALAAVSASTPPPAGPDRSPAAG